MANHLAELTEEILNTGAKFYRKEYFGKKFRKSGIFRRFVKHKKAPFNSF